MSEQEPVRDVAQLGHVELLSPRPADTVWFFTEILGLQAVREEGQSSYLRAYEDPYEYTLKVTESPQPGLGHGSWRAASEAALQRRAEALTRSGLGRGWNDGDYGHGPGYAFVTPDGHNMELFWDVRYFEAPAESRTALLNRPQRRPNRGVPVRRIDHLNLFTSHIDEDTEFYRRELGFKLREAIVGDDGGGLMASWLAVTALSHDIAIMPDAAGAQGRLHHVAYWYGAPQHLYDVADLMRDAGIVIEAGPGKHGISQAMYMYVYEPGGNRVELFGDAGYLDFDPQPR
ncbi:MAG: VOC family protein, partial [Candidatus Dormibacteraeota bacterium]|nr:VOC family protein [Candidatus Dormibacteraeota bacterium]MBO0759759.1 VOC family protein [Candidatus Dormibacteraeota bacterium]